MPIRFRWCRSDEDYARFTVFYIRNRHLFHEHFSLVESLCHILQTITDTEIMLIEDEQEGIVGWGHYGTVDCGYEPDPEGSILFMHSIIVAPESRSHRLFWHGFRALVSQVAEDQPQVREFRFLALRDNAYLNRLYSKFARVTGQREGMHGDENIYVTGFEELKRYLRLA